jgi:CSLREA domain-containing protein
MIICAAAAAPAAQANITVNTTADPGAAGKCSLRKAIAAANVQAPAGDCAAADPLPATTTIDLPPGHYIIGSELEITGTANVFIAGGAPGDPTQTVIDAAQQDRVLQVDAGANASLDSVTVTGGKSADGAPGGCCQTTNNNPNSGRQGGVGANGGGILNSGTLAVTNSAITGNAAGHGGDGGTGAGGIVGSYFNGGWGGDGGSGGRGGGIYNDYSAVLTLTDTSVSGNHAGAGGRAGNGGNGTIGTTPNPCPSPCGGTRGGVGGPGGSGGAGGSGGGIDDQGAPTAIGGATISGNATGAGGDAGVGGNGADGTAGDTGASGGSGGPGGGDPGARGGPGGAGGGIYEQGHSLTLSQSTVSGNVASGGGNGGGGGAAGNGTGDHPSGGSGGSGSSGGNGGAGGGIGLDVYQGLAVTNSTVTGNLTGAGGAGGSGGPGGAGYLPGAGGGPGNGGSGGPGGGIFTNTGTLTFATIAGNHTAGGGPGGATGSGCQPNCGTSSNGTDGAYGTGGGIEINGTPGSSLANTLVASNSVPGGIQNCVNLSSAGPIGDGGHNLSYGDTTCPGINGNPQLGTLQDNGGPTPTMALGAGSAAVDQIPQGATGCPGADQRGVGRPFPAGGQCDIGAFESGSAIQRTLTVTQSGAGTGNVSGSGIDCGGGAGHTTCSAIIANGGQVSLTASPGAGSTFGGFTGGGCGTGSPCTVTMSADKTVNARFDASSPGPGPPPLGPTFHKLTVTTSGSGVAWGTVTGPGINCGGGPSHTACSTTVADGTKLKLTAGRTPQAHFTHFAGGGCSVANPCSVTVTANTAVDASFHKCLAVYVQAAGVLISLRAKVDAQYASVEATVTQLLKAQPVLLAAVLAGLEAARQSVDGMFDQAVAKLPCDPAAGVAAVHRAGETRGQATGLASRARHPRCSATGRLLAARLHPLEQAFDARMRAAQAALLKALHGRGTRQRQVPGRLDTARRYVDKRLAQVLAAYGCR